MKPSSKPRENEVKSVKQTHFLRKEGDAGTLLAVSHIPHHLSAWDLVFHLGLFPLSKLSWHMNSHMLHFKTNLPCSQLSLNGEKNNQ